MSVSGAESLRYVGRPVPRVDGVDQVTGRALYAADLRVPGMVYGKILRSPHPHARIRAIDPSPALELEGVVAVVTARDLPPMPDGAATFGGELMIDLRHLRRLVLAHDKALFEGHAVAAVAATEPEVAEKALELIRVDYEPLPVVEDAEQAMAPDAPLLHEDLFTQTLGERPTRPSNIAAVVEMGWGDVEQGFAQAEVVVERTFRTQMVHQGYLEPQATVASYGPDGLLTVWTCTQGTFNAQRMLAALLRLPLGRIRVVPSEIGGGFGGKIYTIIEPIAALLAMKSGRPVKIALDRAEVFRGTGPGSPTVITVKVGARRDGRITSAYGRLVYDAGAFPGSPIPGASLVSFAPYRMPHFRLEAYDVVTNKPRVQSYRAPGGTPVAFAVETVMDEVAEAIGMDPLKFRQVNAVAEGDRMTNGQPYNRIGLRRVLEAVERHPHWREPLQGPNRGRGLALGFWLGATLTSTVEVIVNADGTVNLVSGQVDLTGTRTTMAQMAAEELQVPLEWVTPWVADTSASPYTDLSAGSRTTYTQSVAVRRACQDALAQMKALAADLLSRPDLPLRPEDIHYQEGRFWPRQDPEQVVTWREVAVRSRTHGPVVGRGTATRLPFAPAFAAHLVDVEVDRETGKVRLLRYTCFQDVGRAVNPQQVEGQMQGGAAQGIGWALYEYYAWDKGRLLNPNFLDYRMPTALDLPSIECVLVEEPASEGPYGARGVGEVPIVPPAAAIANAVYRAVGVRMRTLPMTPEAVFRALHQGEG